MTGPAAGGAPGMIEQVTALPEPVGFRIRYRSEPGMLGHYPWTYADQRRRRVERPECEYEDLYTAKQTQAVLAAENERWCKLLEARAAGCELSAENTGDEKFNAMAKVLMRVREAGATAYAQPADNLSTPTRLPTARKGDKFPG